MLVLVASLDDYSASASISIARSITYITCDKSLRYISAVGYIANFKRYYYY